MSDAELRKIITQSVSEAQVYGIDDESDVTRFVEYKFLYGYEFGQTKGTLWAKEILNNSELSGTKKMDKIDDYDLSINIGV